MSRKSSAYALVEDKRQKQFIYRFLLHAGFNRDKIRVDVSPPGDGSAKKWVCDQFALQVQVCRRRGARTSTCLFAMMDADQLAVTKCMGDLDSALGKANQPKLDPTRDPIARLIPKWSIETRILYLSSGGAVDPLVTEDKSYKDSKAPDAWTELISQASEVLYAWTRKTAVLPDNLIGSLRLGLQEIPRALPVER